MSLRSSFDRSTSNPHLEYGFAALDLPERLQRMATGKETTQKDLYPTPSDANGLTTYQDSVYRTPIAEPRSRRNILPTSRAWRTFLLQEVASDAVLEAQLMLLTFATGVQDATTFATYQVFTTKQTGNTLFLALYALHHPSLGAQVEKSVAVSLSAFIVGAACFAHMGHHVRQRRRTWLIAMNLFQTILVLGATAIRFWGPRMDVGGTALGAVALLSFASSGQIAMAVGVGLAELNTTMITGTLVQIANDRNALRWKNRARNRRVIFFASLLLGCFVGAATQKVDAALGLLVTAVVKALVTVSFVVNPGVVEVAGDEEKVGPGTGAVTPVSRILWGD